MDKKILITISIISLIIIIGGISAYILMTKNTDEEYVNTEQPIEQTSPPPPLSWHNSICQSIAENNLSLCDIRNSSDTINWQALDVEHCKRDVILWNIENYQCPEIKDAEMKSICLAKKDSDASNCQTQMKPICDSLITKDISKCEGYSDAMDIDECRNIFNILNADNGIDCDLQKIIPKTDYNKNWSLICRAKTTHDSSLCIVKE